MFSRRNYFYEEIFLDSFCLLIKQTHTFNNVADLYSKQTCISPISSSCRAAVRLPCARVLDNRGVAVQLPLQYH